MCKVSVIMPTYNRGNVIARAIDSVLSQTFYDFELIVLDDGSKDNTHEVVSMYLKRDRRIKYFFRQNSGKPAIARNYAIRKASGEYLAFLDSDDFWDAAKIEGMVDFIEAGKFDWAVSATYRINNDNFGERTLLSISSRYIGSDGVTLSLAKNGLFSFTAMPIFPGSVLIRKVVFEAVGGFDETYFIGEDSDLWLKLEEAGFRGGYLNRPLYFYNKNQTSISRDGIKNFDQNLKLAKKHLKFLKIDRRELHKSYSDFLWEYAQLYYANKKKMKGIFLMIKSFFFYPEVRKIRNIFKHAHKFLRLRKAPDG